MSDQTAIFQHGATRADPIEAYYALSRATRGRFWELYATARKSCDVETAHDATDMLVSATRDAFRVSADTLKDVEVVELIMAYVDYLARQEAAYRELADMVAAFGWEVLRLPYRAYFGLWLQLPRHRAARAMAGLQGMSAAQSMSPIPPLWFDAVSQTAEEASNAEFECNAARSEHRALSRRWVV